MRDSYGGFQKSSNQYNSSHNLKNFKPGEPLDTGLKSGVISRKNDYNSITSSLENRLFKEDAEDASYSERLKFQRELLKAYKIRGSIIKQKVRLKWELEGDTNSRFYHHTIQKEKKSSSWNYE